MKEIYFELAHWGPYVEHMPHAGVHYVVSDAHKSHEAHAIEVGANALVISNLWQITGEVLDRLMAVEAVARPGIGYDNVDVKAATERGVAVLNTPDGPTESTAEHTVALLLALARRLRQADRATREFRFRNASGLDGIELAGKTLGLIGLGRIGGRVAEICGLGLRMRVLAFDPYATSERARAVGATLVSSVDELWAQSDFVSLHAPPTAETYKIVNSRTLSLMKPTAGLINCGRGALVDEAALTDALETGRLACAALDVFDPEPPVRGNRLMQLDNVLFTPHTAAHTPEAMEKMLSSVLQQLVDLFDGRRPLHLLNPDVLDRPNLRSGARR